METIASDASWSASLNETTAWREINFDDSGWSAALSVAPYGKGPWGAAGSANDPPSLSCAGIPGEVRLVYLPQANRVRIVHLEPGAVYRAAWLDPITGKSTRIGLARADNDHSWMSPVPPDAVQDWLLVLTNAKR